MKIEPSCREAEDLAQHLNDFFYFGFYLNIYFEVSFILKDITQVKNDLENKKNDKGKKNSKISCFMNIFVKRLNTKNIT